jgi:hypothetical protein
LEVAVHRSRLSRPASALAAALFVVGAAGCSDDDGTTTSDPTSTTVAATGGGGGGGGTDSGEGSGGGSESSENLTTYGYRVDGEPGTTVLVETVAETEAGPQDLSQTWSITDEPRSMLFTNWVTGGEISLEVTEGDAATVEIIRGHAVDPEDPFAGIEVVEVLETVEVAADDPVTVTFP